MNKNQIIIVILLLVGWIEQTIAATASQISACEAQSSYLYIYEQCVNCSQNCSLCNGTIVNNICQLPTTTSCLIPGFMFNASNLCNDCRIEENCLLKCDGYWHTQLKTCLRQRNKSHQVQGGISCLSATSATDCKMCTNQHFQWSATLSKCIRCPASSSWDSTTQTCLALSTCSPTSGTGFDGTSCINCSTLTTSSKNLSPYSLSCENCPSGCPCSGIYAKCATGTCIQPYTESTDGDYTYCECKGSTYSDGTNCISCPSNCVKCKSDGKCIQCISGYLIDKASGICVDCAVASTDPIYCEIQAFAQCSQKTQDGKYCNACVLDLVYDSTLRYCACSNSRIYNTNTNTCANCSDLFPNCGTCNSSVCYTCKDSSFTLAADSKSCTCIGYIKNNTCLQCNTNLTNCLTCNSTGTSCITCSSGFGLTTAGACYPCTNVNSFCISCDSSNKCLSCTNGYTLNANKLSCDCDVSTTTRATLNNVCYTCSNAITNCNKCTKNVAGTQLTCTECASPYVLSNGTCQLCALGSYRSNNACTACTVANCTKCNSSTSCFACGNGFTAVSNNSCVCQSPKFVDSTDSQCKDCSAKFSSICNLCTTSACTSCSQPNFDKTANCACTKGVVVSTVTPAKCILCNANCITCTTPDNTTTICTVCDPNYRLMADNTCVQCGTAKYYNSTTKTCNACNTNCSACADNQNGGSCTACLNGYQVNAGACTCTGAYVLNAAGTACVTCATRWGANCATCDGNACLTCATATGYYYKGSTKTCITCAAGTYYKADPTFDCINCPDKCGTCTALTGACTGTCLSNYDLNTTTNLCQCSTTKVLNSGNCVTCASLMTNCTECSSPTTCTKCSGTNRVMTDGTCQPCAAKKYYDSPSKTCKDCGSRCDACADDTGLCTTTCSENYRIDTGVCVCTKDRSLDSKNACTMCSVLFENCIECNSTVCTKCNAPFTLNDQGRCRACTNSEIYLSATRECKLCKKLIRNCNSCSSTSVCTDCLVSPFELSQAGDICNCPVGNYLVKGDDALNQDDQCIPCTSFDKQCLQCANKNECQRCADKYFYDTSAKACRNCNSHEYYDSRPDKNIQTCVDCNQVHVQCIQCLSATECTSCKDNYDAKDKTCKCTEKKILMPTKADPNIQECKKCSDIIDLCDVCTDSKICDKCIENYRWDSNYKRCLPDLDLQVYSENQNSGNNKGKALADNYNLIFKIPGLFTTAQLRINIYFFDSIEQYDSEVKVLIQQNIPNEDIPFSFKNCIVFTTDDLKTLPHPKYTQDNDAKFLRRADTLLLHEGNLKFVYTVESQNSKFVRYSKILDLTVVRSYNNMKDVAFNVGKQIKNLSPFSVYQVFSQILIQQNQICTNDDQCSNNGQCIEVDKLCKCSGNFKLFDCSDYVTIAYDLVIEQITKILVVDSPTTFQEKFVAENLPLLVTQSATSSQSAITQNFRAIQTIMKSSTVNNNQRDDVDNLMRNIMNNVSKSIQEINTDFTPAEIIQTIKDLQNITEQLLSKYDNKVSFLTDDMQLLAKIAVDPSRIVINVDSEKVFDTNQDTTDSLFSPSQNPQGVKAKVLRYSFKENPHKITTKEFLSQPHTYPLFIVNTYQQQSKRMLQSTTTSDSYQFLKKNITFTFHVENPRSLKNLICLTLQDTSSDRYIICESIIISDSTVTCSCENSATIYEDVHYNYLVKPVVEKISEEHVPTSMIIAIVVLSVLLAVLLFIQIRNRKKQQEQEKVAQAEAVAAAEVAHKRKLEKEAEEQTQNQFLRKGSQEMTIATQQYNRTEQYEQGLLSSPPLNVKDIRLNLFDNTPKHVPNEDFVLQDNFELNSKHQSNQNDDGSPQHEEQAFNKNFAKPLYSNEINTPYSPGEKNFIVKQKHN